MHPRTILLLMAAVAAAHLAPAAGTFTKRLTCRFMDEHLYGQTGETMSELTALEIQPVGE